MKGIGFGPVSLQGQALVKPGGGDRGFDQARGGLALGLVAQAQGAEFGGYGGFGSFAVAQGGRSAGRGCGWIDGGAGRDDSLTRGAAAILGRFQKRIGSEKRGRGKIRPPVGTSWAIQIRENWQPAFPPDLRDQLELEQQPVQHPVSSGARVQHRGLAGALGIDRNGAVGGRAKGAVDAAVVIAVSRQG